MSIPVLVVVPASVGSGALAAATGGEVFSAPLEGFAADPNFPMMPIGDQDTQAMLAEATGDTSGESQVAVRGYIEASLEDPPETLNGYPVYADPDIAPFLTCGGDAPVGNQDDVASHLDTSGLFNLGLDGSNVAIAIVDTGINLGHLEAVLGWRPNLDVDNSWTPPNASTSPGEWPVDHGTMCAFDALIAAPNATLIDVPVLSANMAGGGSIMSSTLAAGLLAYSYLYGSWNSGLGSGDLSQYNGLVCSNSWGIFHPSWDFPRGHRGRYCDNPRHPFMLQLEAMSKGAIDMFFAAGNCGADCPDGRCQNRVVEAVMGASASIDVMSIAGCDINEERVGYSSQGPGITGLHQMKPDITSYTHFLGSRAFGDDQPDSGTSAACPVAAGCMAALRTSVSPRTPATTYMMYDHLRLNSMVPPGQVQGWNADFGHGIIRPVPVANLFFVPEEVPDVVET
jgi:serine protease AprX